MTELPDREQHSGGRRTPTRMTIRDLGRESLTGLVQRPARSALTMLGTVLGVGAFVAVLGLTTTAASQIGESFNALAATTVTVNDLGDNDELTNDFSFTDNSRQRVTRLNGVVDAGTYFIPTVRPAAAIATTPVAEGAPGVPGITLTAVDTGMFGVTGARVSTGRIWDDFAQDRGEAVAVLGAMAASALNITRLDAQPVVFVNSRPYTVIGIVADFQRLPELAASVMIPTTTALTTYGPPVVPRAAMIVETDIGAAQLIAGQAATALRPERPELFEVLAPTDPTALRATVAGQLNSLFLILAAISLLIGGVGIANTTLVAVLERTGEIGLRRAVGARGRHIAIQFLAECAALGTVGGLIGTTLGLAVTLATALVRDWTPVVEPWTVAAAPFVGAVVGTVAGLYPALRAARIEPATALRR